MLLALGMHGLFEGMTLGTSGSATSLFMMAFCSIMHIWIEGYVLAKTKKHPQF